MKCKNCNEKEVVKYSKYSSGEFCSRECARGFSTKAKRKEINEKVSKKLTKEKHCRFCDDIIEKKSICFSCKKWMNYKSFYMKLGIYDEFLTYKRMNKEAVKLLFDLYFNKMFSINDLVNKFNIQMGSFQNFFRKNNLSFRSLSDSIKNAYLNGKVCGNGGNNQYKSGWHKTWDKKQVYYRSSYELEYAKELDKKQIPYEMEFKRFLYWDSQKEEWRTAIPDFYLPLENKIVEIKSSWTYDKQNMIDRIKEYKKQGYNFELLLEKETACISSVL